MTTDTLTALLQNLDEKTAAYGTLNRYYAGEQPLTFLAPEIKALVNNRLSRVSINVPRLLVDSIAERLRIVGLSRDDVWADWSANDLDTLSGVAHREALTLGDAYAIVWANGDGSLKVSVESAEQVTALTDPGTRKIVAAVKRWQTAQGTFAVLYGPDKIERYASDQPGASTTGFRLVETIDNPLGVVPVVRFRNGGRLLEEGISEMSDVLSLTDAAVKLTTDLLTSSEYAARPRRWATGVELVEDETTGEAVNPSPRPTRC